MRRRATIEPVVGHLKDDIGCAVTISKAATETASTPFSPPWLQFHLLLRWFEEFLRATFLIVLSPFSPPHFV
jgi:hypothetical protein